jgi:hypothetical protein
MSGVDRGAAEQVREHVAHTMEAWRRANEAGVAATPRP